CSVQTGAREKAAALAPSERGALSFAQLTLFFSTTKKTELFISFSLGVNDANTCRFYAILPPSSSSESPSPEDPQDPPTQLGVDTTTIDGLPVHRCKTDTHHRHQLLPA